MEVISEYTLLGSLGFRTCTKITYTDIQLLKRDENILQVDSVYLVHLVQDYHQYNLHKCDLPLRTITYKYGP